MARLRYNGLKTGAAGSPVALSLGASLTDSATSVTFNAALTHANGTAVPTLAGSDYIPLAILDTSGNLTEIVWLTAYTAAATTGTISRGQEGTSGVAHSSGDKIVCAILAVDVNTWLPNLAVPLDTMTGLATPAAGTWSVVSGVVNQASTAASVARVSWASDTQVASGVCAAEVELRRNSGSGGSQRIGLYIGAPSSGSTSGYTVSYLQTSDGTNWTMYSERDGIAIVYTSSSFAKTAGAWMRLSLTATPGALNMYVDGTFIGSTAIAGAGSRGTRVALYTYGLAGDFRNLKTWDSILNPPPPF